MKRRHLSSLVVAVLVVIAFAAMAGSAQANSGSVDDVEVINREDVDGDGYVSSFQVRVQADTDFAETAGIGKGNPVLIIDIRTNHGTQKEVVVDSNVGRDGSGTWIYDITGSDVQDLVRDSGPTELFSVKVRLYDENNGPGIFSIDDPIDDLTAVLGSNNMLENPSQDEMRTLTIESNPGNAEVRIDGELEGETPLDIRLPVDVGRREGSMTVEVRKEGYEPASRSGRISPPDTYNFDLDEIQKPIVVSSDPSDADVYVDGSRVGTTPWSGDFWVRESVDIRVEKPGYQDRTRKDVSPEASIHFDLTSSDSSGDGSSDGGSLGDGVLQDPAFHDPFIEDFYVPDLTRIPELESFIVANFTLSPSNAVTGQQVEFNASPSFSLGMTIDSYSWDFDDGSTASGEAVTHSFSDDGTYSVELEIQSQNGNTSTVTQNIQVRALPPNARFSSSTFRANVSESIQFDASSSNDPDGNLASYTWRFGDGSTASGQTVTHSYGSTGTYNVKLTVEDDDGETDTTNSNIEVLRPPNAAFMISNTQVGVGESVSFDASASNDPDGSITAYRWDFGDGNFSGGQTSTHTYSSSGTYTVELGVQDNDARTDVTTQQIQVTAGDSGGNTVDSGGGGGEQDSSDSQSGSGGTDGDQPDRTQSSGDQQGDGPSGTNQTDDGGSGDGQGLIETLIDSILDFF